MMLFTYLIAALLALSSVHSLLPPLCNVRHSISLRNSRDESDLANPAGMKGFYRRPSKAIEKGGGFFVPGLEGEKIRVFSASLIFLLYAVNRLGVQPGLIPIQQVVSEFTGLCVTAILFTQGFVSVLPLQPEQYTNENDNNKYIDYLNVLQSSIETKKSSGVTTESIARSIVQTCNSISHVIVTSPSNDIMLELGSVNSKGCVTSADTLSIMKILEGCEEKDGVKMFDFNKCKGNLGQKSPAINAITGELLLAITDDLGNKWLLISKSEESDTKWIRSLLSYPY